MNLFVWWLVVVLVSCYDEDLVAWYSIQTCMFQSLSSSNSLWPNAANREIDFVDRQPVKINAEAEGKHPTADPM